MRRFAVTLLLLSCALLAHLPDCQAQDWANERAILKKQNILPTLDLSHDEAARPWMKHKQNVPEGTTRGEDIPDRGDIRYGPSEPSLDDYYPGPVEPPRSDRLDGLSSFRDKPDTFSGYLPGDFCFRSVYEHWLPQHSNDYDLFRRSYSDLEATLGPEWPNLGRDAKVSGENE